MKRKWILVSMSLVVLLLTVGVGLSQAQEPPPPDDDDLSAVEVDAAVMNDVVPIQGRLTDASGNPVPNGNYSITASIYDVATLGVARCTDTDTVTVTNGLFNMNMDSCTASDINGDQLWLGIKVGADDEMTPRQVLNAVPYAWNVRPGAIIKGAESYLFVPGSALVKNLSTDSTRWDIQASGAAQIYRGGTAGGKYVYYPVTLPSVLYGQPVRVTSITVYYKCENSVNGYITDTYLRKQTDADSYDTLVSDDIDRTSTTASSYTLATSGTYNTLSSSEGILFLMFDLEFLDDTDYIQIGGVRLTLEHDYASP